jgi:hypothetical protein
MKRLEAVFLGLAGLVFLTGCSLSPEDKVAREQALQQAVLSFTGDVVQANWPQAYALTDGSLGSSDQLKNQLMKSWVQDATLTNGDITSLAWVNDHTAKVKLTWSFQAGSVESFSNETFIWIWAGNGWKYKGRALR